MMKVVKYVYAYDTYNMVASATQVVLGNYSESDITMLGTIGQIGAGLLGADLPADLRDLA